MGKRESWSQARTKSVGMDVTRPTDIYLVLDKCKEYVNWLNLHKYNNNRHVLKIIRIILPTKFFFLTFTMLFIWRIKHSILKEFGCNSVVCISCAMRVESAAAWHIAAFFPGDFYLPLNETLWSPPVVLIYKSSSLEEQQQQQRKDERMWTT